LGSPVFHWIILLELLLYFGILGWFGARAAWQRKEFFLIFGLPLAIAVMHLSWGSGFSWSILKGMWER
jgi:hypothetical protein